MRNGHETANEQETASEHGTVNGQGTAGEHGTANGFQKTARMVLSALLLALMLVLGYVEHLLPSVGIPGIKLGLSNSVLIFAVYMLSIPEAYMLMTMKVLLSGILFSGPQAMAYAFAGGLLSVTGMWLFSAWMPKRVVVVSMVGGLLHNLGQAAVATLILHISVPVYWLALLGAGLACGALTGIASQKTLFTLKKNRFGLSDPKDRKSPALRTVLAAVALVLAAAGLIWYIMRGSGSYSLVQPEDPSLPQMVTFSPNGSAE